MNTKPKLIPKELQELIASKSLATGILILDDYRNGKVSIKKIKQLYQNFP